MEELIDVYDENRNYTGLTVPRVDAFMKDGQYTLYVLAIVQDAQGRYLITQRALDKSWGAGWWEVTGGGVPAGLDLVYTTGAAAVTLTYGANLPAGSVWQPAYNATINLTGATAGNYITVALVNHQTGKVVSGGNAVLVVGA